MVDLDSHLSIEEYVKSIDKKDNFSELFEAKNEDVALKTELQAEELLIISKLKIMSLFIKDKLGASIKFNILDDYIEDYMKLKVSYERKSRAEFVDVNRQDRFEQNLGRFNNFQNLSKVKE